MNDFAAYQSAVVAVLNRCGGDQLRQRRCPATSRDIANNRDEVLPTKSQNRTPHELDGLKPSRHDGRDPFRGIRCNCRRIRWNFRRFRRWISVIPTKIPAKCRHHESFKSLLPFLTALSRQDGIWVVNDGLVEIGRGTVVADVKARASGEIGGGGEKR